MAYDEDLADRVRALLPGDRLVERRMFGGLAFLLDGHMAVAVSGEGGLMLRVDPGARQALLEQPGAGELEMGGRGPMRGWLRVDATAVGDDADLARWVRRAVEHTATLPPKDGR